MIRVTDIPFVKKIGIRETGENNLELPCDDSVRNHINTVHAGAQFALAETASGAHLLALFPELEAEVLPILKDSRIRYRNTTSRAITAYPSVPDGAAEIFLKRYRRKGRALLTIHVVVRDDTGLLICESSFNWFIKRLTPSAVNPFT